MNERLEHLMYSSGLTASGCWDEMDDYAREAVEKFAELIVRECIDIVEGEDDGELTSRSVRIAAIRIKHHFGVTE
jgi:hypothetical protein